MTATLTLATWLEEQLVADEAEVVNLHDASCVMAASDWTRQCDCGAPAHALAQIAAVREVLALHVAAESHVVRAEEMGWEHTASRAAMVAYGDAILILAKPYADRPGYAEVAG